MIAPGFEKVGDTFERLVSEFPGAGQIVVRQRGQVVVDLASSTPGQPTIGPETPFLAFSISKAFTTLAVLKLIEEGQIELDAPIARYWPAFGQGGKQTATIRHALKHQAGIPAPRLRLQVFLWPFWGLVTRMVAGEKAVFAPGSQTGYHLVNFGFILGEVVRRASGAPVDRYLQRHFFEPMGLKNTWMRVPAAALRRSPKLVSHAAAMDESRRVFNLPAIRRALLPAGGLHTTARDLASVFQMLLDGGEYQGRRYLRPETIRMATLSEQDAFDTYLQTYMNWGLGFIVGGGAHRGPDPLAWSLGRGSSGETFSAAGMGTCLVWADRPAKLVTAFTTNAMLDDAGAGRRWAEISNAVWDAVQGVGEG